MKILSASQTREADQFTIKNEPITSLNLMERAARAATQAIERIIMLHPSAPVLVFCGMGNNGGDGLAIARMLHNQQKNVQLYILRHRSEGSPDYEANLKRIMEIGIKPIAWKPEEDHPELPQEAIIIDAILGSGLQRPLEGFLAQAVQVLNGLSAKGKIAIDIPTGLFADGNAKNDLRKAMAVDYTVTFQHPKRSLLNALCAAVAGEVRVVNIGLSPVFYARAKGNDYYVEAAEVRAMYRPRSANAHKGTLGHALLVAGSENTPGAALLAAEAILRSGCGLLTANVPATAITPLLTRLPEAMLLPRKGSELPRLGTFQGLVCGPGLGTNAEAAQLLKNIIQEADQPLVLDADALNILAENPTWLSFFRTPVILTPHPGEWQRLCGQKWEEDYPDVLRSFAQKYKVFVILKNKITTLATPSGSLFYSQFGSSALATAGAGDVLSGILGSVLTQGYTPLQACLIGLYLHGTAGGKAAREQALETVLASDVLHNLSSAFKSINEEKN